MFGCVVDSMLSRIASAWSRCLPQTYSTALKFAQTAGRSGCPKILQPNCSSSWMQGTPAGLPLGMPGMGLEIEGAMQQAPQ